MKNFLIIGAVIVFFLLLANSNASSSKTSYYEDEIHDLEQQVSDLEDEISDLERCNEEYQYALEAAKSNMEYGYYQDAYYDLDGIEPFCLY